MAVRGDWTPNEVLKADDLNDTFASKLDATAVAAKILQVVRATDATQRTTTSTSFVDASLSVTITPQKSDSAILVIWTAYAAPGVGGAGRFQSHQITDSSNNPISGAEGVAIGVQSASDNFTSAVLFAYSTPATTSATTYKGRFSAGPGVTARLQNNQNTGQMYALEIRA